MLLPELNVKRKVTAPDIIFCLRFEVYGIDFNSSVLSLTFSCSSIDSSKLKL